VARHASSLAAEHLHHAPSAGPYGAAGDGAVVAAPAAPQTHHQAAHPDPQPHTRMAAVAPACHMGLLLHMRRKVAAVSRRGWEQPYEVAARAPVGSLAVVEHLVACKMALEALLHLLLGSMHLWLGPVS
jgi:hypothetical protein